MLSPAIAGHGATIAMQLTPGGAFTTIGELQDISRPEMSRGETEVTSHQRTMDDWVLSKRILRGPLQATVNFVFDDTTHDHLQGLQQKLLDGIATGFRVRGPDGDDNIHEWIGSGEVQSFGPVTYPVREGVVTAPFTIRLSGPMIIDGVEFGATP